VRLYVTMLTVVLVLLFGFTFLQSVATTKVINIFASAVATLIFAWHGVVNYKLGVILGLTMFLGACHSAYQSDLAPPYLYRACPGLAVKMVVA
jgi:uncharacterized membrane protein YfcA